MDNNTLVTFQTGSKNTLWKKFFINVTLVILIFTLGVFIGIFSRNKRLINRQMLSKARSHFHSIILTRRWSAEYGGVYVEKRPGITSNPYLENPDLETIDGRIFTKKNPALITREISEYATRDSLLTFHITSLNPINPNNTPDEFERESLKGFEAGVIRENIIKEQRGDRTYYRYIAPLFTENNCLGCHAKQGYKTGDIRGGISVAFDISTIEGEIAQNNYIIIVLSIISIISLLGLIYLFTYNLMKKLDKARKEIERLVITDELTGLHNRRHLFEIMKNEVEKSTRYKHKLSCVIIDIDFFKKVNDTYGHITGDTVIRETAAIINKSCRTIDYSARYGGEEFVIILPETDANGSYTVAEKVRTSVKNHIFTSHNGEEFSVTISLGIHNTVPEKLSEYATIDDIVHCADEALLQAKSDGRDRIVVYSDAP